MNGKIAAQLLAIPAAVGALTGSPYSADTSLFPKRGNESRRPMGKAKTQGCCKCYTCRTTLYKFEGDKRICKKCRDELLNEKKEN